MRFAEDSQTPNSIQSISADGVVIDNRLISESVLVSGSSLETWAPCSVAELTDEHLGLCMNLQPEIVIIGTGRMQSFPPAELLYRLQKQGIGVEVMANDAACRTFNVLLSEDRHVVLALIQPRNR